MTNSYAEDFVAFLRWLVKDVEEADINEEVLEQARAWFVHLVLLHEVTVDDAKTGKTKQIKYYKNYVSTSQLSIYGVVGATEIDGRRDLHSHLAFEYASVRQMACVPMLKFSVCFPC